MKQPEPEEPTLGKPTSMEPTKEGQPSVSSELKRLSLNHIVIGANAGLIVALITWTGMIDYTTRWAEGLAGAALEAESSVEGKNG